jgi:esterase/lipase
METNPSQEANLLAETLQKNGIACCPTEAMEKANKIINNTVERKEDKFELLEQKYKSLLNQSNNQIVNEINNIKNSINCVILDLNSLRKEIAQQPVKVEEKPQEVKEEVQEKIQDVKEPHPKQGNITSDDVSIEKFFYFGKKEE